MSRPDEFQFDLFHAYAVLPDGVSREEFYRRDYISSSKPWDDKTPLVNLPLGSTPPVSSSDDGL